MHPRAFAFEAQATRKRAAFRLLRKFEGNDLIGFAVHESAFNATAVKAPAFAFVLPSAFLRGLDCGGAGALLGDYEGPPVIVSFVRPRVVARGVRGTARRDPQTRQSC